MDWFINGLLFILACYLVISVLILLWYLRIIKIHQEFSLSYQKLSLSEFITITMQIISASAKFIWWRICRRDKSKTMPSGEKSDTHVLCVHGLNMDGSCFWGMRQFLANSGYDSSTINLGLPYTPVEKYVSRLERRIEALINELGERKISIVAHSMGGLITRLVLQKRTDLINNISVVVTLGTPHYGTSSLSRFHSNWIDTLFNTKSKFLADIPAFNDISSDLAAYSVASHHDFIVFPEKLALLSGTEHVVLQHISHVGLLTESRSHTIVKDCIHKPFTST